MVSSKPTASITAPFSDGEGWYTGGRKRLKDPGIPVRCGSPDSGTVDVDWSEEDIDKLVDGENDANDEANRAELVHPWCED